jgi:hypothetical protein
MLLHQEARELVLLNMARRHPGPSAGMIGVNPFENEGFGRPVVL